MAINEMLAKNAKQFDNVELEVILKNIITVEEKGRITLVFHAPAVKNDYRKTYIIDDIKGRVDFNRVMFSLGCTKNNYDRWLNTILINKITLKVSINSHGFVRYVKMLEKEKKELIAKHIYLDTTLPEATGPDREFLMGLTLLELKKEFGQ